MQHHASLYPLFSPPSVYRSAQRFVLKMVEENPDGSSSITTSIPCAAGASTEVCMVQVSWLPLDTAGVEGRHE